MSQLRYLENKEINKKKWDACIHKASNRMIYAESVYLDTMAANWDAIIVGEYKALFPLTWKKKFGIRYLYQPAFLQQGGIYGNDIDSKTIEAILRLAQKHFNFAEINLNYYNKPILSKKTEKIFWKNNYILCIDHKYADIQKNYSSYISQRIQRAQKNNLSFQKNGTIKEIISLYKKLYHKKIKQVKNQDYLAFESLCKYYDTNKNVIIRKVYDESKKELVAAILLLKDENRIYNILSCILPNGKKLLANYFLYDAVIEEFSNQGLTLDFEGSDIPGVAYFYNKFTSENQQYPFIKWNHLPKMIQWIKK